MAKNEIAKKETGGVVAFDPNKAKIKQRLVMKPLSIRKMAEGDVLYIKAESEIQKKEKIEDGKASDIYTIIATDLNTGEIGELVLPVVARRGFELAASQAPLTGRLFAMRKGDSTGPGKCNRWEVVEFAIEG